MRPEFGDARRRATRVGGECSRWWCTRSIAVEQVPRVAVPTGERRQITNDVQTLAQFGAQ